MNGSEVVDANGVKQPKHTLHSFPPPAPTFTLVGVPTVENCAPFLSTFREIIGWDTGHHLWHPRFIELEEMAVGQYICRVVGDEDGQVADEGHPMLRRRLLELLPGCLEALLCSTWWRARLRYSAKAAGSRSRTGAGHANHGFPPWSSLMAAYSPQSSNQ